MKGKRSLKKHTLPDLLALFSVCALLLLGLFSLQLQTSSSPSPTGAVTGAAILKNKCTALPQTLVYVSSNDNHVYALDPENGCIVWRFDAEADLKVSPAVTDAGVFVGTAENSVFSINAETGEKVWSLELDGKVLSAGAVADYFYVADNSGVLSALDLDAGTVAWTYTAHNLKEADVVYDELFDNKTNTTKSTVFVVDTYLNLGSVIAINTATHNALWVFPTQRSVFTAPLVATDAAYIPTADGTLFKLNKEYGVVLWTFKAEKSIRSTPVMDDKDVLYVGSNDGYVYAINSADGSLVWKYFIGHEIETKPALSDTLLYVGSADGKEYALDKKTGTLKWSFTTKGKIQAGATLYDDVLFIPSTDSLLYAVDAGTGQLLWSYDTKGALYSAAVVK